MPITFKTTKFAVCAGDDPKLYEILRDIGEGGTGLADAVNKLVADVDAIRTEIEMGVVRMRAQEFLASGTWTAPAGVTEAWITACAGGGGGGGRWQNAAAGASGGGGGGDSVYRLRVTVTPGVGYTVTVGGGGARGTNSSTAGSVTIGATGGTTSVGALVSLTGGAGGGPSNTASGAAGGAPGGPGGTYGTPGETYLATYLTEPKPGIGGTSFPGGYGSGGPGGSYAWNAGSGSAGAAGYVLIEWNE